MQVRALKCFGEAPGGGNPALVIEGDSLDEAARRAFAQARNTTCVFLDGEVVDFYYPHMRSPLCLHATLAVAHALFARHPEAPVLAVTTAMRGQRLELRRDGADYFVRLQPQEVPQPPLASGLLERLLAAPCFVPVSPPHVASVGSPKLLVELPDAAVLHGLRPGLDAITAWGKELGVNGIYAWCRLPDGSYEGRNFNHLDPKLEDSATGVAAGALTALLGHGLTLRQGHAASQPCLIRTRMEDGAILVGGRAEAAAIVVA
ncbi:PhzF family phenazine biosynthesis protein [Telluria aromaticivorans]|uniref:PhzF family phenazine biosynthesis protein n=1 Tax=Telluria aromaticivorans TaxID=2725995 RepID=A0A7Y2JWV0_9BURK|nr:PhzF family phenazine biosynthesis protein [Telluria aromaticivorans]NNG22487.1 PhzF family phenazine biosynthesis protein [Telluria aromaticivorans]